MLLNINQDNPDKRKVDQITKCLENGGIIVYPTDTLYTIGCSIFNSKAMERIRQIKGLENGEAHFSLVCHDLSQISEFTAPFSKPIYKMMKRLIPGPYTFILKANKNVPKLFKFKKDTVGIRVPDNNIPRSIVESLGHPITSTSIHHDDKVLEYMTDPEMIYEKYHKLVDIVVDGGFGDNEPSTVLDMTSEDVEVIREGKGMLEV
ncbi:MAG: threonylcarbamoyl-AMP synthase [Chitinophagaceae bacterium]|nr:MAG: threonylcarbamoyl-AMP synthase [Chitinophagaceae bacterium]